MLYRTGSKAGANKPFDDYLLEPREALENFAGLGINKEVNAENELQRREGERPFSHSRGAH